jgi:Immunity protein 35
MITMTQAEALARTRVNELARAANDRFELLEDQTRPVDAGWLFFFNSADFIRTRDPIDALAGNGPILVFKDGRVVQLSSALPIDQALMQAQ